MKQHIFQYTCVAVFLHNKVTWLCSQGTGRVRGTQLFLRILFLVEYQQNMFYKNCCILASVWAANFVLCFDYIWFPWTVLPCTKWVLKCRPKQALTPKQYRLLLYHQAIKLYITYEQNRFICTGPLILLQCDMPLVIYCFIACWYSNKRYYFSVRACLDLIMLYRVETDNHTLTWH